VEPAQKESTLALRKKKRTKWGRGHAMKDNVKNKVKKQGEEQR
jgi:hypothetical protein